MAEEADVSDSGLGSGGHDSEPQKPGSTYGYKSQLKWTPELHARFVEAVERCGGHKNATPKQVQLHMNVEGVSVIHVKSHLQKHRLKMKEMEGAGGQVNAAGYPRHMAQHADAAALGMLQPQLRGAGAAQRADISNGAFLGAEVPGAKRMRTSGTGLLGSAEAAVAGGRAASGGVADAAPTAAAAAAGGFRPLPRSTLADLAGGGDQLYQLTQAQQQAQQPYPPFKPTAHIPGFSSVPTLAQLPSTILTAAAAAAATGLDWTWLGQLAGAGGGALPVGGTSAPEAVPVPAFSLPLPSPLAAPASYPAAQGADAAADGGTAPAAAAQQAAAAIPGAEGGGTPAANAAAAQLAMTNEGLQLLAQLAAASGVTPVAMAAAPAGVGEAGEGTDGTAAGAGNLDVIRACFGRLQLLLKEQARLQQELNIMGENALAQLTQLRAGLEAYFAHVSAFASAIAMVQQPGAAAAGAATAAPAGGAGAEGAAQLAEAVAAQQAQQGAEPGAAEADKAPLHQPATASTALLLGPSPPQQQQQAGLSGAPLPLSDAVQLMPGGLMYWGPEGMLAHHVQQQQQQAVAAAQEGAQLAAAAADAAAQQAQQGVLQQPSTLAALGELLKGASEGA